MKAILKLLKSFGYAFRGFFCCLKSCRNLRIHIVATAAVLYFAGFYDFEPSEKAVLFLTFALVIGAELFNSAVEYACDAFTEKYTEKIKLAKDAAAAGVLVCALFAVCVAAVLFIKPDIIWDVIQYHASALRLSLLCAAAVISVIFIFYEDILKHGKQ